ncbi:Hypothetical predicted protein, partial [Pelobates cultripes]
AAYLHNIAQINLPAHAPQWVAIESHWPPQHDLQAVLWLHKCPRHIREALLPSTQNLLRVWSTTRNKLVSNPQLPMATPIQTIGIEIPTFNWDTWRRGGIHHIYQVIDRGKLKTLPAIQTEYALPTKTTFSYLQLKSYVSDKLKKLSGIDNKKTMTTFERQCVGTAPLKKAMSWGYQKLVSTQTHTLEQIKKDWYREI